MSAPEAPNALGFRLFLVYAGLVGINLIAFASVGRLGFVDYDDNEYVAANPHIAAGLTWSGLRWAVTSGYFANWHPLTWVSHMLDVTLFGLNPGGHHAINLVFHIAATLLLFANLHRMTNAPRQSAVVAVLFAVHPVHVESVAWVSERKDVLSTLMLMLTLWMYVSYVERSGVWRYAAVVALMALGLMAKPMLVTLPLVMLLLDVWPLRRPLARALVLEKLPLFALAAASSVITIIAQRASGALMQLVQVSLDLRAANALISYARYIGKTLWPVDLIVMYPLPSELPSPAWIAGALVIMLGITSLSVLTGRRYPYLLVGWLWYVVTLLPVIGIVQVGAQSMADRYTYVPSIGLFIMIAWGVPDALRAWPQRRLALQLASAAVITVCTALTFRQVQFWRSSLTLWQHAVDATPDNYFAQGSLGYVLWKAGNTAEAMPHYERALRLNPNFAEGHNNIGVALAGLGRDAEALPHFAEAVRLKPTYAVARQNLDATNAKVRTEDDELRRYALLVRDKPNDLAARNELGAALAARGRIDDAIREFGEALRINPTHPDVHYNLGIMLDKKGRAKEAIEEFRAALKVNPNHEAARQALQAIAARPGGGDLR
jgi:Flp pilus assembly protein TadD